MRPPLLEASGITKSFAGVRALRGVSFELRAGEVHALIGENGAGKSTLIKIMAGAVAADSGVLRVSGEAAPHNSPAIARALGIAVIYQQPALFPHLTVAENIALALEPAGNWRKVDWAARERRAKELLARAGATDRAGSIGGDAEYAGAAGCRDREGYRRGSQGRHHGRTYGVVIGD